jgi:tripartite-type tricarboxylate transporter receptor subunit TctC
LKVLASTIRRRSILAAAAGTLAVPSLRAAAFPDKTIKVIMPWPAGGGGDVVTRIILPFVSERLGQAFVVENRPGASGSIGSAVLARSAADGYTLGLASADSHSIAPHVLKGVPYNGVSDFTAIAPIGQFPFGLVVNPKLPIQNVPQFVAYAKAAAQPLSFGTWGVGSSGHVLGEVLKASAGIKLLHVPYQGAPPLVTALISNEVNCSLVPLPVVEQHVKSGSFRLLAVCTPRRISAFAGVPTLDEAGINLGLSTWIGIVGPAKMPADVVAKLRTAFSPALRDEKVVDQIKKLHVVPDFRSGEEFAQFLKDENDRWARAIAAAHILPQ